MGKLIKKLEEHRLKHKVTQAMIAKILGVSVVTVNRWFNGKFEPNQIQKYHIKKFLKDQASGKSSAQPTGNF